MPKTSDESTPRPSRRQRIKEAGGWYRYYNERLIKLAGPADVGPYETTPPPSVEERAERACPVCGKPINRHTFDRSGERAQMYCP